MVKTADFRLLDTTLLDSALGWLTANISEIVDVIIGTVAVGMAGWLLKWWKRPQIVITFSPPRRFEQLDPDFYDASWLFRNLGRSTADVKAIMNVNSVADDNPLTETKRKIFVLFEDSLPPPKALKAGEEIRFGFRKGDKTFAIFRRHTELKTESVIESKEIMEDFPVGSCFIQIRLQGSNLTEKDRMVKRYALDFKPDGIPKITVPTKQQAELMKNLGW